MNDMIIPIEKRVIVYSIAEDKIINIKQKSSFPGEFNANISEITQKRNECVSQMSNENNLH